MENKVQYNTGKERRNALCVAKASVATLSNLYLSAAGEQSHTNHNAPFIGFLRKPYYTGKLR